MSDWRSRCRPSAIRHQPSLSDRQRIAPSRFRQRAGKQWRQLWADADRIVTVYMGGPAADGTFVLTSEPKGGGTRWRYTYRNIRPSGVEADYASRVGEDGPW